MLVEDGDDKKVIPRRGRAKQTPEDKGQNKYALKGEVGLRKYNSLLVKSLLNVLQRCRDLEA